ncbi:MAG: putative oxidoreductase [Acidobacteriota bacterium]|jgi:uncharacterized oxidoreductase
MNLSTNTVLITGGGSGIGLALATRFHRAGSTVAICGRREDKLREARERLPGLLTHVCDLSRPEDRRGLAAWVVSEVPSVNVLVNNAGVQHVLRIEEGEGDWGATQEEIAINLEAPVHLATLLAPHLRQQQHSAIINVTSGLAFTPLARVPVYSATKAALHSFTLSLRHQLAGTPIAVIEIAPPAVDTDLGGPGLHTFGVNVDEFADAIMPRLAAGELEMGYGFAEQARRASRHDLDTVFQQMNQQR